MNFDFIIHHLMNDEFTIHYSSFNVPPLTFQRAVTPLHLGHDDFIIHQVMNDEFTTHQIMNDVFTIYQMTYEEVIIDHLINDEFTIHYSSINVTPPHI